MALLCDPVIAKLMNMSDVSEKPSQFILLIDALHPEVLKYNIFAILFSKSLICRIMAHRTIFSIR
jgi:hypothetical protein